MSVLILIDNTDKLKLVSSALNCRDFSACERCKKQEDFFPFCLDFFFNTRKNQYHHHKNLNWIQRSNTSRFCTKTHKYEPLISTSMPWDNNYKEMQNNTLKSCIIYLLLIAESRVHGMFVAPRTSTSLLSTPTPSVKM